MNISGVSSSSYTAASSSNNTSAVKALEKQIASVQKEMAKVQADKTLDDQTKSQQVAAYQTQIQNLQAQVAKVQQGSNQQAQVQQDNGTQNAQGPNGAGKPNGPPPPPPDKMDFENISDDDLKSYLEKMQELTGTIPGIGDSETVDIEALTDEQLNDARTALSDMQQQRFQESMRGRMEEMMVSSVAVQTNVAGNVPV